MFKCYSVNEEDFDLETFDEVIERLEDNSPLGESPLGAKYWEADAVPVLHKHIIASDDIRSFLERLDEQFEEFLEVYDSVYSDVPKEAVDELRDIVLAWADRHITEGRYYRVKDVQQRTITQEDLDAYE